MSTAGRTLRLMALALLAVSFAARANHAARGVPLKAEEVSFAGATDVIRLAGTLTRPGNVPKAQRLPAVVLIHGSGPNDRDETLYGHKPFLTLAEAFTASGYAVLRYDKRGVGASNGTPKGATLIDYAADAEAAFDYLKSRPDIDGARIGLLGHSEGGMIAPLIASRRADVAWLILLAPPTVNGREIVQYQNAQGALDRGATEKAALEAADSARALFDIVTSDLPETERDARLLAALRQVREARNLPEAFVEGQRNTLMSNWFRHILTYDPVPALQAVKQPALVLFAERDHQVPPSLNEGPARAALAGNPAATVRVLPDLNHLFLMTHSGAVTEYPYLKGSLGQGLLDALHDWLDRRASPESSARTPS